MKRNHIFLTVFLFLGIFLTSCGDDNNDDETYYSGDAAKQAAKGTWVVNSINISSDDPAMDIAPNYLFKTFLYNLNSMTISLGDNSVRMKTDPKNTDLEAIDITEGYTFVSDKQLLVTTSLGLQLPFDFTVSNKRLVFSQQFNKLTLVYLIQAIGGSINNPELETIVEQVIQSLPNDYTGKLTIEMNK